LHAPDANLPLAPSDSKPALLLQGYVHYISTHCVKPPKAFIDHVLKHQTIGTKSGVPDFVAAPQCHMMWDPSLGHGVRVPETTLDFLRAGTSLALPALPIHKTAFPAVWKAASTVALVSCIYFFVSAIVIDQ
jgi:hypothetical protein